ncbi:HIRAN domain-containing protein [Paracoccus saliphilus]
MRRISGPGDYEFDIVGESHYQAELTSLAGPKTEEGVELECDAVLMAEPSNPYDANAVAVLIEDKKVGYLSRADAARWTTQLDRMGWVGERVLVEALIVGGWLRKRRVKVDEGSFGVKLDLDF